MLKQILDNSQTDKESIQSTEKRTLKNGGLPFNIHDSEIQ